MLSYLIIEDEAATARRLERMVATAMPELKLLSKCDSVESSLRHFREHGEPDLIFMDIQLADGISFELFEQVELKAPIIFTTAYDEFAVKAFKVNSIDYLLKPINQEELEAALVKWKRVRADHVAPDWVSILQAASQPKKYRERFLITRGDKLIPVLTGDISVVFAEDKAVFLSTKQDNRQLISITVEEMSQQLNPADFFRANRSILVNRSAIISAELHFNGKIRLVLNVDSKTEIFVSRDRAAEFKDWWGK